MRSYTLFDEKNVATDWVSEELAEGNCSTSFESMGKYWAFYSDGRLWEATLFENSRHELRLVNRDYRMKCDIVCMMDRLQRLSDSLDELRLEVGWDGKDTLIVRPYYAEEPFTLLEVLEKSRVLSFLCLCTIIVFRHQRLPCSVLLSASAEQSSTKFSGLLF